MGDYANRVFAVVRRIPRGKVATYGQVARLIGAPRTARYVGYALHANPEPGTDPGCIPCHRVVFKDGRHGHRFLRSEAPTSSEACSPPRGSPSTKRAACSWNEFQWDGRPESAGAPGNAHVTGDSGAADTADATDYPTGAAPDFDWEAELAEHPLHHCETCAAPRPDCKKERHA